MARQTIPIANIVKLHRMHQAGQTITSIARELGHARNTIAMHLSLSYQHRADIATVTNDFKRPKAKPKSIPKGFVELDVATYAIPVRPKLSTARAWATRGQFLSDLHCGRRITTLPWLKTYIRRRYNHLPTGIAIRERAIDLFCLTDMPPWSDRAWKRAPRIHPELPARMLWDIEQVIQLQFPTSLVGYATSIIASIPGFCFVLTEQDCEIASRTR